MHRSTFKLVFIHNDHLRVLANHVAIFRKGKQHLLVPLLYVFKNARIVHHMKEEFVYCQHNFLKLKVVLSVSQYFEVVRYLQYNWQRISAKI